MTAYYEIIRDTRLLGSLTLPTGNVTIGGALNVSGSTTLNILNVTGNATFGALSSTGITENGTQLSSKYVLQTTSVSGGTGLTGGGTLTGNQILSVVFGGNGTANTSSRSDHNHDSTYLALTGGTLTGRVMGTSYAVNSTLTDLVNNSPWYGTGYSNLSNGGSGYYTQVAGYWGLLFKTAGNELKIIQSSGNSNLLFNNYTVWNSGNLASPAQTTGGVFTGPLTISANTYNLLTVARTNQLFNAEIQYQDAGGNILYAGLATGGIFGIGSNSDLNLTAQFKFNTSSNTMTINGNTVWHAGNLNPVVVGGSNQNVGGGFQINSGYLYVGSASGAGNLILKNASNNSAIQLDGSLSGIQANVNSYIDASGNATLKGTVSINTLQVTSSGNIANLNAQYINGVSEPNLAKITATYEIGGAGVYSGCSAQQVSPSPTNAVQINAGTVYTSSGKRFSIASQQAAIANPDTTNNRYDVVYVQGPSAGAGEGLVVVQKGTASSSPVEPSIPSDGIKLYRVLVLANAQVGAQATITDGTGGTTNCLTDERAWKPVIYDPNSNSLIVGGGGKVRTDWISTNASNMIKIDKPIQASGWATSLSITSGNTSIVWNHNLNLTNYAISLSSNMPDRHIYWSGKSGNSIQINIDDTDNTANITVDAVIHAY